MWLIGVLILQKELGNEKRDTHNIVVHKKGRLIDSTSPNKCASLSLSEQEQMSSTL